MRHASFVTTLCAILIIAAAGNAHAATNTLVVDPATSMDTLRQQVKTDERGLIESSLELTTTEAKQFWPLYDRYHRELDRIIGRQNRSIIDYIHAEPTMTNANAKRIAAEMLKADADELRLRDKQLRKTLAVLPATKAVRYIQLETRIRTLARYDVAGQLSLVQ
jgi:Spy/CpxP family protein refolding chaperone